MTPLDDELRSTLSARAAAVTAPADPLAGIEARASRIRRRRAAVAVTGVVAAVAAVALAVPALVPDRAARVQPGATTAPGALPANAMSTGDTTGTLVVPGTDKVDDAWVAAHPGAGDVYALRLLDARQDTTPPITYAIRELWHQGGPAYAVVAQDTATSPVLVRDAVLPRGAPFIDGVVGQGSQHPLVVYALAKGVTWVGYDKGDGVVHGGAITSDGRTGGVLDRTGPKGARDRLVVHLADASVVSQVVWLGPNDDFQPPANLVTWVVRGDATLSPSVDDLLTAYASARGADRADVAYQPAFSSQSGPVLFTVGQAWVRGDAAATTVSYETGGTAPVLRQYGRLGATPPAMVALVTGHPGTSTDLLVVVPRPGVGQVSYSATATGAFQGIASGRSDLNGIGYVDRAPGTTGDRLEVLEGDGMHVAYRGPVSGLLCVGSPCS